MIPPVLTLVLSSLYLGFEIFYFSHFLALLPIKIKLATLTMQDENPVPNTATNTTESTLIPGPSLPSPSLIMAHTCA